MTDTNPGSPSLGGATSNLPAGDLPGDNLVVTANLTTSARSHAQASQLLQPIAELRLPGTVAVGDMVCLVHQGVRHNFTVARRDWIVESGELRLEVMLDHPARPGPRAR